MVYLIVLGVLFLLAGGFLTLIALEADHGRLLKDVRGFLDTKVTRLAFIARHVDWSAFVKHVLKEGSARVAHDLAHGTLVGIRFMERTLTRAVRTLRERGTAAPKETSDGIVRTVRKFRKRSKKEAPEAAS